MVSSPRAAVEASTWPMWTCPTTDSRAVSGKDKTTGNSIVASLSRRDLLRALVAAGFVGPMWILDLRPSPSERATQTANRLRGPGPELITIIAPGAQEEQQP